MTISRMRAAICSRVHPRDHFCADLDLIGILRRLDANDLIDGFGRDFRCPNLVIEKLQFQELFPFKAANWFIRDQWQRQDPEFEAKNAYFCRDEIPHRNFASSIGECDHRIITQKRGGRINLSYLFWGGLKKLYQPLLGI